MLMQVNITARRNMPHHAHRLWDQPVPAGVVVTGRPEALPFLTYETSPFIPDLDPVWLHTLAGHERRCEDRAAHTSSALGIGPTAPYPLHFNAAATLA